MVTGQSCSPSDHGFQSARGAVDGQVGLLQLWARGIWISPSVEIQADESSNDIPYLSSSQSAPSAGAGSLKYQRRGSPFPKPFSASP